MYTRTPSTGIEIVDRWETGIGWIAHPEERTRRASHAIRTEDGVWVFDPLDGPGVEELIADLGPVAGVVVLSNYHARDAAVFAKRHGVAVHLPDWMDHAAAHVDAPVTRHSAPPGEWVELRNSGIRIRTVDPRTAWKEAVAYQPSDGVLRIPDMLLSLPWMRVRDERIGCYFFHRFAPPREAFSDIDPERILFGHGEGIAEDAPGALASTLDNARRNLPYAVVSQAPTQIRGIIGALRD